MEEDKLMYIGVGFMILGMMIYGYSYLVGDE